VAREHEKHLTSALDERERARLQTLLEKLAASLDLTPGIHPGYRSL
jgi:hypothetical protein